MKRNYLLILSLSYIGLISIIIVIGLAIRKSPQATLLETADGGTTISQNTLPKTATPTFTLTSSEEVPAQTQSPTPEVPKTLKVTPSPLEVTSTNTSTPLSPTSTQEGYPINGENTATITSTQTSYTDEGTPTLIPTPTRTRTLTRTAVPQTGWGGEWVIYWENEDGTYSSDEILVTLNGDEISAQANINDFIFNFEGKMIREKKIVEGLWENETTSGFFYWEMGINTAFSGNWNNEFGFCGVRPGNDQPDNCKIILVIR